MTVACESSAGGVCPHERCRDVYERLAGRQPLGDILGGAAEVLEATFTGSVCVVHALQREHLVAYTAPGRRRSWLQGLQECGIGTGSHQAPWWRHRGRVMPLCPETGWAAPAALAPWRYFWSTELVTGAGEIVGTLLLLFRSAPPGFNGNHPLLREVTRLAALAMEQEHLLQELTWAAHYDALTGLMNRAYFERWLEQRAVNGDDAPAAVFWFDLDGFARVNRIFGYRLGDRMLAEAATRLRSQIRSSDGAARAANDEFLIAAFGPASETEALGLGARLQSVLAEPYELDGHSLTLTATGGIAFSNSMAAHSGVLLQRARTALACAGRGGPGRLAAFSPEMEDTGAVQRFEMEQRLREALPRGELLLYYQPQVRLADESLTGVEALLRWRHGEIGMVSPAVFIPIAEQIGLIGDFGRWVMQTACRQGCEWWQQGRPLRIGVNVSPSEFCCETFADSVEVCLKETGLDPAWLEIEITESQVLSDFDRAVAHLKKFRSLGVHLALDDFGTGHSSLAYLRDLPVHRVKIDRSFLAEIQPGAAPVLLANIIRLAHELGLSVITEAVETPLQLTVLAELGCDEVQGFYYSKPLPAADLTRWREAQTPHS